MDQLWKLTYANIKGIRTRWRSSIVLVVAVAGVVAVVVGLLSLLTSIERTVAGTARPDRAIVLGAAASSEAASTLSRDALGVVESSPAFVSVNGKKALVREALILITLPQRPRGDLAELSLRGTSADQLALVRPEVRLLEGRLFEPGKKEVIVGAAARSRLMGRAQVGDTLTFNSSTWTIVGIFSSGGDLHESEIWADAETVLSDFRRPSFQSATGLLISADSIGQVRALIDASPGINAQVQGEVDYFKAQSQRFHLLLNGVARIAGGIMALGALLAGINAMMSALEARSREIGVLLAIGFGLFPIIFSMVVEALLLTLAGAGVGALLVVGLLDGSRLSTFVRGSASRLVFELNVDPAQLTLAIGLATVLALLSCIVPGVRARKLPVTALLRAT